MKKLFIPLFFFCSVAHAGDVRLGFAVGDDNYQYKAREGVEESALIELDEDTPHMFIGAGRLGYQFDSNFSVDLYRSVSDVAWNFFGLADTVRLEKTELLIGYYLPKGNFYLEPKIGVSHWNLVVEEGQQSGPEERFVENGYEATAGLTGGYRFNDTFGISLSYKYLNFDFGISHAYTFGWDFWF